MFRPDRIIKASAQIARNSRLKALDLATRENALGATTRRPFNVIQKQASELSTSTAQFKDKTGKTSSNDTPILSETAENKESTSKLGNLSSHRIENKSAAASIQEAAANAFREPNEITTAGLTNLAEHFPLIRDALLQNNNNILDSLNIDVPKKSREQKIQTSEKTEIKIYHWEDATDNRTIYTPEQEQNILAGMISRNPDLAGKITIVHYAQDSYTFNCHAHTFANDTGWVDNQNTQNVLDKNFDLVTTGKKTIALSPAETSKLQEGSRLVFRIDPEKLRYMQPLKDLDDKKAAIRIKEIRKRGEDILHSGFVSVKNNELYLDNKGGLSRGVWDQPLHTLEDEYGLYYEIHNPKSKKSILFNKSSEFPNYT